MATGEEIRQLGEDMRELMRATGGVGWDKEPEEVVANPRDLGSKGIPKNQWTDAFKIALKLHVENPWLPIPTPGADPDSFVWLTYKQGESRVFALQIHPTKLVWTMRSEIALRTFTERYVPTMVETLNHAIRECGEAMRATFRVN